MEEDSGLDVEEPEQALSPFSEPEIEEEETDLDEATISMWEGGEKGESEIVHNIQQRVSEFSEYIRLSGILPRIKRAWCYYHGLFANDVDNYWDHENAIRRIGDEDEIIDIHINHYRSLLQHSHTLATQFRPQLNALAMSTDPDAMNQARITDDIIEYYMKMLGGEKKSEQALKHMILMSLGFLVCDWDTEMGEDFMVGENGNIISGGDNKFSTPTIFDAAWDPTQNEWEGRNWFAWRERVNRWDLIALYPDLEEQIKQVDVKEGAEWHWATYSRDTDIFADILYVWHWYHRRCPALPDGRYVKFVDDFELEDGNLEYRNVPVQVAMSDDFTFTSFGYTAAFDIQASQEAYDAEMSSLLTNHAHFALKRIWTSSDDDISVEEISTGLAHVQSQEKPEVLNFNTPSPESWKSLEVLRNETETVLGINSTSRGDSPANIRAGNLAALVDAKSVQINSPLTKAYDRLLEGMGTLIIHNLQDFPDEREQRTYTVMGKSRQYQMASFKKSGIDKVDRVIVEVGNALTKTLSGRVELANMLVMNFPQIFYNPAEQILNVIQTGKVESLTQPVTDELALSAQENEDMMRGEPQIVAPTDNHILHIREHKKVISNLTFRRDQALVAAVAAHIMEHIAMLADPGIQGLQISLGHQLGPFPAAPPPGMDGSAPPPGGGGGGGPQAQISPPPPGTPSGGNPSEQSNLPEPAKEPRLV